MILQLGTAVPHSHTLHQTSFPASLTLRTRRPHSAWLRTPSTRHLWRMARAVSAAGNKAPEWPVLLYVPNVIGYARLALLLAGWSISQHHGTLAATLFVTSMVLDGVDGVMARRLGQVSEFGAVLDVWVDNLTRGLLWSLAPAPAGLCVLLVMMEMTVFLATHKAGGSAWKRGCFQDAPPWVGWLMASGFHTPQGCLVVAGLFGLPFWLWATKLWPSLPLCCLPVGIVLAVGRLAAAAVELWVIQRFIAAILRSDAAKASKEQ